jgi:3-deoxy-D-manno-octulosonic-acid transferase
MRLPLFLTLYGSAMSALLPVAPFLFRRRAARGKEDPTRLHERLGWSDIARPDGVLVWLHGASVGETRVNLALANALAAARPDLNFLFTTHTRTGEETARRAMPSRGAHQFAPFDAPAIADRFINHWRPDLAVFAESELWPSLICAVSARGIKLALVNARMSGRSLQRWARRAPNSAAFLLARFDWIGAADSLTAQGLSALAGRDVPRVGNIKLDAPPPQADERALSNLRARTVGRRVWCAASTHTGEDEIVLAAHNALRAGAPETLLILAPRHPKRGDQVEALVRKAGFSVARRSRAEALTPLTDVYLADTIGEMGALLRAAPVVLLGGSLVPGIGGHNPAEPIGVGAVVLTGPETFNFAEIFADLRAAGGTHVVTGEADLARSLAALLSDSNLRAQMREAAERVLAESGGATPRTAEALLGLLREAGR